MAYVCVWLVLALTLLLSLLVAYRNRRRNSLAAKIPGPRLFLPLIGSILDFVWHYKLDSIKGLFGLRERFGPIWSFWVGHRLFVNISDHKDIESVVTSSVHINKGDDYKFLYPWLGRGLLVANGQLWHIRRKQLTPTFHFRILENFVKVFNTNGAILLRKLQAKADGTSFDITPFINLCALDIICETAMGTSVHAQEDTDSEYVRAAKTACTSVRIRAIHPWLHYDSIFNISHAGRTFYKAVDVLHSFTEKVFYRRKDELTTLLKNVPQESRTSFGDLKHRKAFLDQLLTMSLCGENILDPEILDEVNTFMFEGHDTSATSLCFTIYLLSKHPEVQAKILDEVESVVGDQDFTLEDINKLKYLEQVIKESLRLYPSVPVYFRTIREELILPSGFTLPAHTTVIINAFMLHRDPEFYPEPLKFDPDRFIKSRSPFSYLPFSAGPRNCIGQKFALLEMKVLIAKLVRKFVILPPSHQFEEPKLDIEIVMRSKNGILVQLQKR